MKDLSAIRIKNMVCPRCITAVETLLNELGIEVVSVALGEVILRSKIDEEFKDKLASGLNTLGFELLESEKSSLISQIKILIMQQIRNTEEPLKVNFSTYLSDQLHREYTYLSKLFSSTEGITIEKYITSQKIEQVKELLFYDQLTLSEIAIKLDYSSVAHLSAQFKKETGMTPSAFKKQNQPGHRALDSF